MFGLFSKRKKPKKNTQQRARHNHFIHRAHVGNNPTHIIYDDCSTRPSEYAGDIAPVSSDTSTSSGD